MTSRVMVVGGGGREHALCLALTGDPEVASLVCAPGNAGTAEIAEPRSLDVSDPVAVASLAEAVGADYVVVGPEVPLVAGAADVLRSRGIETFGPGAVAAQLEGSKAFAKSVMATAKVPTARSSAHTDILSALAALPDFQAPFVVKADGLAAGKGVVVTTDRAEAERHIRDCGGLVVIEDYLDGPEVSLLAIVDDHGGIHPFAPAQDHKRVGDGDKGPNTGGMGSYAPLAWAPAGLVADVITSVLQPTVTAMADRGTPFQGLLYAGLAITADGPRVIEFNARFGDPETQALLALQTAPLLSVLRGETEPSWSSRTAVTVVLAAHNYPGTPRTGDPVTGLAAASSEGVVVHHAGTTSADGRIVSSGGRVLAVTATGDDLTEARDAAYRGMKRIELPGGHWRTDIGARAHA